MKDLRGKRALVTGAASGIGRALALALAREGMDLLLVDLDGEGAQSAAAEIAAMGRRALAARCDVSDHAAVRALADDAEARLGPVDLLVNNAGIGGAGLVEELEPDEWKRVFEVNTWSIVYAVRAFLPRMIARGHGHIVNTGSGAGIVGIPYHIQYVVSKFAVVGITEALYSEIKHVHPGIDISVICPTYLNTRIIDRTDIRLPAKLVPAAHAADFEARKEEFKRHFWVRYNKHSMDLDRAVARYVRGIRQGRLYIHDSPRLRVAQVIKGLSDAAYRAVLRREGRGHLDMIAGALRDMGIPGK